jgi:hypothetical protein
MNEFYDSLPLPAAQQIEQLSRLAFELREDRRRLLESHGVDSEPALLERIAGGGVAAHPAYEHYLGARALAAAREAVRRQLREVMGELEANA